MGDNNLQILDHQLRRTYSAADCSQNDRTPVKASAEFGANRNNYSARKSRKCRSETFGSQYQMYFAVSDDSEAGAHCYDELQVELPRTTSNDSPLPTSADFISTNDTPSSGSNGRADSGRGGQSSKETAKVLRKYRRSAKESRHYRRRRDFNNATACDGEITSPRFSLMQRSHTYNENLGKGEDFLTLGEGGRASSLDGRFKDDEGSGRSSNRRHRHPMDQSSSSFYSSDVSGTESGCSADADDLNEETHDRLHSTDAVRAAMHRFRWKYCRRGSYGGKKGAQRSASLNSVDAAAACKYSISESAIQELHEVYEAYCAKYSSPIVNTMGSSKRKDSQETWATATTSTTTTAMMPVDDTQNGKPSPSALKNSACRSWESENSTLHKNWKRLIEIGQDVAAPSHFDQSSEPQPCDTTLTLEQPPGSNDGLLQIAGPQLRDDATESSDNALNERADVDWDTYQPPVYTASSDDGEDGNHGRQSLLLSEDGIGAVDDDYFERGSMDASTPNESPAVPNLVRRRRQNKRFSSLQSVLDDTTQGIERVAAGLTNIKSSISTSPNFDLISIECRHMLEAADDNLGQLQNLKDRLNLGGHNLELVERIESVIAVWQRMVADLLGEQRKADDLLRASDELRVISDVIPALEQRLGVPNCSSPSSELSNSHSSSSMSSGIFRFDSVVTMLEASEESLRIGQSISQLKERVEAINEVAQMYSSEVLLEQTSGCIDSLQQLAEWNDSTRTKCDELHRLLTNVLLSLEDAESKTCKVERKISTLQSNLSEWAKNNTFDDNNRVKLEKESRKCRELLNGTGNSLVQVKEYFVENLEHSVSQQAISSFSTRLGAIKSRIEGENGRLDTLQIAIELAVSALRSESRDGTSQTPTFSSTSCDAQTEQVPEVEKKPTTTPFSWTRCFVKYVFPAQLAIVSLFLILRLFGPFEPIRVTPLLHFNNGPPPM